MHIWPRIGQYTLMARETQGFSERFPSLMKGSRAGKPPFLPLDMLVRVWFAWGEMSWSFCSGLMQSCLQRFPLRVWGDACSSLNCYKLDFCFAAVSSLIYHPYTFLPMQDHSLSLINFGNYSFHPEEHLKRPPQSTDERVTTWSKGLFLVNELPQLFLSKFIGENFFQKECYRFYLCSITR